MSKGILRTLPAVLVSSLLAACSGTGAPSIPTTSAVQSANHDFTVLSDTTARGDAPETIHYFGSKIWELNHGGAAKSKPGGGGNLAYHGGPIQPAPKTYVVYWGSAWTSGGDPNGMASYLNNFLGHVGGTSWNASVTQYTQADGTHVGNPANNFGGSYVDTTSNPPSSPTQSQMAAEAVKAAAHFGNYTTSAQYIVAMPSGVSPSGFKTQYCAYHSSTSANGSTISWTNLPYLPDAGTSCGSGSVTGSALDGVSIVEGHEMAESETDPQPNSGWLDGSGAENGDKCAWTNLQNTNLNGTSFPTQPLWSNAYNNGAGGCVQSYP